MPRGMVAFGILAVFVLLRGQPAATPRVDADPFAWLQPAVTIDGPARTRIDSGEVFSRVLPAPDGQIAVALIGRLEADPDRLEQWAESIADLKKSSYVIEVHRFSDPPVAADVGTLALDAADVEAASRCVPHNCAVKGGDADIDLLRRAAATADRGDERVQEQFREIVLSRVTAFNAESFAGLSPYADRRKPADASAVATSLLDESPYLRSGPLADPGARTSGFFYWSKEQYGAGKRTITVTHVDIVRPAPPFPVRVAVIGKEIFASHYRNGSLGLTAVVADDSGDKYLVYVNRTQLDMLGGIFGTFRRAAIEGRLGDEGIKAFEEVRRRLNSGPPPNQISGATPQRAPRDRLPAQ
jgi:hypothetical protein